MVLLILTSLAYQDLSLSHSLASPEVHLLLAQIGALALVFLVYHFSKQLLVSMIVGIATLNGLLWVFAQLLS
jgi:branched-subunit amino acid transport protein